MWSYTISLLYVITLLAIAIGNFIFIRKMRNLKEISQKYQAIVSLYESLKIHKDTLIFSSIFLIRRFAVAIILVFGSN